MDNTNPIVGIDLGTTNSLVAIADSRGPRILKDGQGRALIPSVVRFERAGRVLVGHEARDAAHGAAHGDAKRTIFSVKRLMGRSVHDAAADRGYLPYQIVEGPQQTARVLIPADDESASSPGVAGRIISPQEVSALVLRHLKVQAEHALGVPVRRAVVTVPAYFDDAQRQATRDAGRLAGLEVVRIVNEPTAATLAYGLGLHGERRVRHIAVYDLGGGTFDISILRITPGQSEEEPAFFEVLATAGDTHLGGDDIDRAIVDQWVRQSPATWGLGTPTAEHLERLRSVAQALKHRLTNELAVETSVELGGRAVQLALDRSQLDALMMPIVDRTLRACDQAMNDAKRSLHGAAIEAVVMVGGMTRAPIVRQRVGETFGLAPYTAIDPDEAVALGAAVQAGIMSGALKGALLLDVIPLSLGIETVGGAVAKLIMRNTTVPARATEMFSTSVDGQTAIKLTVLQGEREMAEHCRKLGEFHLRGLPRMPAGVPQVQVEFLVDAGGVLQVSAVERRSGKRAELQIIPNHGLTREEVEHIEAQSLLHAREDMARHRIVDLITNSKLDLKWIGERFKKHAAALEPDYRGELERAIAMLESFVERATRDWSSVEANAFHRAKESLDRTSVRLQEISIAASLQEEL